MAPKKKTIVVVKEIKPESPKKGIYVARAPRDRDELESFTRASLENNSQQRRRTKQEGGISFENTSPGSTLREKSALESLENKNINKNGTSVDNLENNDSDFPATVSPRLGTSASRIMTVGSKRSLSASQTQALLNPATNPEVYLSTLKVLQEKSRKINAQDKMKEATMIEYLPVNERLSLNKEGKVMTLWQERQRSWQKIQDALAKVSKRDPKNTIMGTIDEYRAKMEEYDILQAAIPPHERFNESSWEMTLRGGTGRGVPVGHRFSGLYAPVKTTLTVPIMVRKAKSIDHSRKNMSYIDETPDLVKLRKRLKKYVAEIRPHSISVLDAEGLVLQTTDLFQWAQDSSKAVIDKRKAEEDAAAQAVAASLTAKNINAADMNAKREVTGPSIEILSSREFVFTSVADEVAHQTFSFKNNGPTVLTFLWRMKPERNDQTTTGQVYVPPSDVSVVINDHSNKCREHLLNFQRPPFFCASNCGQALPGETVHTVFSYTNRTGGGGTINQEWMLETTPRCIMFLPNWQQRASHSNAANGSVAPVGMHSPLYVNFRGHTTTLDINAFKRDQAISQLGRLSVRAFVEEIVARCIARVRTPVTAEQIRRNKVDYFLHKNAELLKSISDWANGSLQLFLTYDRYELFSDLFLKSDAYARAVRLRLAALQGDDALRQLYVKQEEEDKLAAEGRRLVRDTIFPVKIVEIFDQVDDAMVDSPWDMDVLALKRTLEQCVLDAQLIADLEAQAIALAAKAEKERFIAKMKAEDSDYEEEEEEEDEDDDGKPAKKAFEHLLVKHAKSLLNELKGKLMRLTMRPVPDANIPARAALMSALESLDEFAEEARADVEIMPNDTLPILPNAFFDTDAVDLWKKISTGEGLDDFDNKGVKKLTKSSKAPKEKKASHGSSKQSSSGGVAPALQTMQYRRALYSQIYSGLLDKCDEMYQDVYSEISKLSDKAFDSSVYRNLEKVAVIRSEDLRSPNTDIDGGSRGSVVFLNFDGDAFISRDIRSAFNVLEKRRQEAIQPIEFAAENGASAIVLLYEKRVPPGSPVEDWSLLSGSDIVLAMLKSNSDIKAEANAKILAKKRKNPPVLIPPCSFTVQKCSSIVDLKLALEKHSSSVSKGPQSSTLSVALKAVPLLVLETICEVAELVPKEPSLPVEVEDDVEAPIPLAFSEAEAKRVAAWKAQAPRKIPMTSAISGKAEVVSCYTDVQAALADVLDVVSNSGLTTIWVEGHVGALLPRSSLAVLSQMSPLGGRFVSRTVKQGLQWGCCLTLLRASRAEEMRALKADVPPTEGPTESLSTVPAIANEFAKLFPISATPDLPRFLAILGGSIRMEKFAIMDRLLDQVHTIFLLGELSLPFLNLSSKITLSKYNENMAPYNEVCRHLIGRARMLGVRLLLPEDLIEGDEKAKEGDRIRCYNNVDPDSRDDGIEYEGDVKTSLLYIPPPVVEAPTNDKKVPVKKDVHHGHKKEVVQSHAAAPPPVEEHYLISGYVYDIGPRTCRSLQEEILSCDILLSWGVPGFCEASAFQAGMRALVSSASKKVSNKPSSGSDAGEVEPIKKPLQTIVIGDTTVEWWSRIADADGEKAGDLVRHGLVSYMSRDSSLLGAVLGSMSSHALSTAKQRDLLAEEWMLDPPLPVVEEEEEEEDDEDEDDD